MLFRSWASGVTCVATVFPDDNKKYLSTDLLRDEPVRAGYLAPQVELLGYRALKRVCHTCFEPEEEFDGSSHSLPASSTSFDPREPMTRQSFIGLPIQDRQR